MIASEVGSEKWEASHLASREESVKFEKNSNDYINNISYNAMCKF